jgi:hypothetical protein
MGTAMMTTADLTQAIQNLEDKKQALTKRAASIAEQITGGATRSRMGETQNAVVAEQSAIAQAIEVAQVMAFVVGTIDETKNGDRKANISVVSLHHPER